MLVFVTVVLLIGILYGGLQWCNSELMYLGAFYTPVHTDDRQSSCASV